MFVTLLLLHFSTPPSRCAKSAQCDRVGCYCSHIWVTDNGPPYGRSQSWVWASSDHIIPPFQMDWTIYSMHSLMDRYCRATLFSNERWHTYAKIRSRCGLDLAHSQLATLICPYDQKWKYQQDQEQSSTPSRSFYCNSLRNFTEHCS